jgi:ATP-dependent Lon protease
MSESEQRLSFPVLPLRDIVVFPHMIVPLFVGREKSVRALEDVMKDDKQILLVTQKNAGDDDPEPDDIYSVGTVGTVLQLLKLPDGTVKVLVEGTQRAEIVGFKENSEFFESYATLMDDPTEDDREPSSSSTSSSTRKFLRKSLSLLIKLKIQASLRIQWPLIWL